MKIILASQNQDKLKEFEAMVQGIDINFSLMSEHGFSQEIKEDGSTYAENALIKARAVWQKLGNNVLADDSGLSVNLLDGYPGIYSARFAGLGTSYEDKIKRLWFLLKDYPQSEWTASFYSALAFIDEAGKEMVFEGRCQGLIINEMRGEHGFGYDPIFFRPREAMCTAEMEPAQKHEISHRGRAFQKFLDYLKAKAND